MNLLNKTGFDVLFKGSNALRLLKGLTVALNISFISIAISIVLGLLLGALITRENKIIKLLYSLYLNTVRIMPQLVLLFIVFFASSRIIGFDISAYASSLIVFSFWGTAEVADLTRSSLSSIAKHHWESAASLGMEKRQVVFRIIIPQAVRRLIPLLMNLITRMIKTTSLVLMIGIVEVVKVGQQIIEANRKSSPNAIFAVYLTIFLLYFLSTWPISKFSRYLEKRWSV